ncbi:MAG: hypothetical protein NXH70_17085 [Hyphomonas sp.]|nr:hypothetical protein [Hyphomonas sp.]
MTDRLIAWFLFVVLAAPAWAQTITLRSGEHGGFTRLALDLPAPARWAMTERASGASVSLDFPDVRFDTRRVFDRIQGRRLESVDQARPGAPLDLKFTCNCTVDAFLATDRMLVLDIRERRPDEIAPPQVARLPEQASRFATPANLLIASLPRRDLPDRDAVRHLLLQNNIAQTISDPDDVAMPDLDLERALRRTLGGVVQLEQDPDHAAPVNAGIAAVTEPSVGNVSISDPTLPDFRSVAQELQQIEQGPACVSEGFFRVMQWAQEGDFGDQRRIHRQRVFGETATTTIEHVLGFAKFYLHFGFAAEALSLVRVQADDNIDADVVIAIAEVLEKKTVSNPESLSGQITCDPDAMLWAYLAQDGEIDLDTSQLQEVVSTFMRLPKHLKTLIGPQLSTLLLASDQPGLSRIVLNSDQSGAAGFLLAQSYLEAEREDMTSANELIRRALQENSDVSAESLVALVENKWREADQIEHGVIDLLRSYFPEHEGTELEAQLVKATAQAHILAGEYEKSFDLLHRSIRQGISNPRELSYGSALAVLTENASDPQFVQTVFSAIPEVPSTVPITARLGLARRLIDLGFLERALDVISNPGENPTDISLALAQAEVLLDLGRPRSAEMVLFDFTGAEVEALRELASEAQQRSAVAESQSRDNENSSTSEISGGSPNTKPGGSQASLAFSRQLLEDTAQTRNRLLELIRSSPGQ